MTVGHPWSINNALLSLDGLIQCAAKGGSEKKPRRRSRGRRLEKNSKTILISLKMSFVRKRFLCCSAFMQFMCMCVCVLFVVEVAFVANNCVVVVVVFWPFSNLCCSEQLFIKCQNNNNNN